MGQSRNCIHRDSVVGLVQDPGPVWFPVSSVLWRDGMAHKTATCTCRRSPLLVPAASITIRPSARAFCTTMSCFCSQDELSTRRFTWGSDEKDAEAAAAANGAAGIKAAVRTKETLVSNSVNGMIAELFALQTEFNESTPEHLRNVQMSGIGDWNADGTSIPHADVPAARASVNSPSVTKSLELEETRTFSTRTSGGFKPEAQKTAAREWIRSLQSGEEEEQLGGSMRRSRTSMRERMSRLSATLTGLAAHSSRGSAGIGERGSTLSMSLIASPDTPDYEAMLPSSKTVSFDSPDIVGPQESPDEDASEDNSDANVKQTTGNVVVDDIAAGYRDRSERLAVSANLLMTMPAPRNRVVPPTRLIDTLCPQDISLAKLKVSRLERERKYYLQRTPTDASRRQEFDEMQESAVLDLAKLEVEDAEATAAGGNGTAAENGIICIATFVFGVMMHLLVSVTLTVPCADANIQRVLWLPFFAFVCHICSLPEVLYFTY